MTKPRVLLISGSLRAGSTNEAVIRAAEAETALADSLVYGGMDALPHFNPDHDRDPLPAPVAALREAIDRADALLICTPEYAGTLPGSFKNLLDWTVGGTEISDKPTAWINAAAVGRGGGAEATLRTVLGYTGAAIVEDACLKIPIDRTFVDEHGRLTDEPSRQRVAEALKLLTGAVDDPV
ncbi:NADPH-dependent FMN reductase [Glycomyces lechevalierae]|uniref:NAD(P)H-dependent FMN reductase n=1 Tax=Glycomyces lechevalierae TaxID=256034 RepID=A0A9X3PDY5_9ACTN|nr:NADPH-dependent FMN reductase [Glycomyces lechevalierae]MDA1383545.1 NAD(P)H-dependent oxidoreductase [Glycomyces lechevalierae]MDR7341466.1 NAD(P)H-dependent FMN reductase [Glycomyces lechevalierae]